MRVKLPFIGGQYQSRSKSVDVQETINYYPEREDGDSKSIAAYIGTPGLQLLTTLTDASGNPAATAPRGLYVTGSGRMFSVNNSHLYEIFSNGLFIIRGTLNTGAGYAYMIDNGVQMLVTDGTYGYVYDMVGNNLAVIPQGEQIINSVASVFPTNPGTVAYRDGIFLVNLVGTPKFWGSAAYDAFTWPVSHNFVKETDSDPVTAIVSTATYLWIFGARTTELWYSTGTDAIGNPPFARAQEMVLDVGTQAPSSVATNGNDVFWLGSNPQGGNVVWQANAFTPTRLTTHAEEFLIGQIGYTQDATGYCYQQEGHFFYVVNFPSGARTHCYDQTTKLWHRRAHWNKNTGRFESHLVLFAASFGTGSVYGLDRRNGNIYTFNLDNYSDNGDPIRRVRTMMHTHKDQKWLYVYGFEIDMQKGVGLGDGTINQTSGTSTTTTNYGDSDLNDNPQMALQWSKDGGYTWSKEHWASMGKIGAFKQRVQWAIGMGKSRDWVFRLSTFAKVKMVLIAAYADIEVEAA